MDDIQNIQLPETAQSEDTRSESIDYEEDTSILDNSDSIPLKNGSPTIATNEKTDGEKLVQNTDNLLNVNINSPKTTLLGKLKAKQRLQAFLLPKQNPFLNSPIKKTEEISTKNDKNFKKTKQSPMEKAKSIIEELEEIKKVEIAKLISPLFKERRSSYREKQYRRKSRSRSLEYARKVIDKSKYPDSWEEVKERQLTLDDVREIKLSKKNSKHQETSSDYRKQLLFESPAHYLNSLKIKGINGQEKIIPSQSLRYTKNSPSVSYSVNQSKYSSGFLSSEELSSFLPKSHLDIIKKFRTNKLEKFPDDSPKKTTQKWYPKQPLSNITEGCELLEKSLSLSILQNYMDEDEDEEKVENKQEKSVVLDVPEKTESAVDEDNLQERSEIEPETHFDTANTTNVTEVNDSSERHVEKEEVQDLKNENEAAQEEISKMKREKDKKSDKIKYKKDKKEKRESRKRKRKKDKQEKDNSIKRKKEKNKSDKKVMNSDQKKERKSKKKETDKKADGDGKKKSPKENKKDKEVNKDEKKEEKVQDKVEIKVNDDKEEIKRDGKKENRKEDNKRESRKDDRKEFKVYERRHDKKDERRDSKNTDKRDDRTIDRKDDRNFDRKDDRNIDRKDDKNIDKKDDGKHPVKESKMHEKKDDKSRKSDKNKELTAKVQLYFDEFESISCRSLSKEKVVKKEDQPKSHDTSREYKNIDNPVKEEPKKSSKNCSGKEKKTKDKEKDTEDDSIEKHDTKKDKKREKFKDDDNLFKIEPLNPEEDLATPDTDEYHSHWESDEDVSNVISYSPLMQGKLNTSWESDEDEEMSSPDKIDRYLDESSRRSSDRTERHSKKFAEGERSLEMPLNILNVNRKDSRRIGKSPDFTDRKFMGTDMRLMYTEDSWERGEYLKICNDIEDEKLRHERKTLSEERRLLEWEKRKLAEKLEKKSFDIFEDFNESIVKEVTYERIYAGNEDVYLKSTEYINEKKSKTRSKAADYDVKKKSESTGRKRKHSHEESKRRYSDDHKKYKSGDSKTSRHEQLEKYDVKCENYKEDIMKTESRNEIYDKIDRKNEFLLAAKENFKSSEYLEVADDKDSVKPKMSQWSSTEKPEKCSEKIAREPPINDSLMMSDISESLNSTCDSLLIADTKATKKSDILENEYEEFLKAVTSDISNSGSVSKERKKPPLKKKKEAKKTKRKRRRKYSSSSSSSDSSSSDSDTSSSSSSSSSYSSSTSSSSSASSYERKKKRRKLKLKAKAKAKRKQREEVLDTEKIVKIEMTHSIVKDLDDLQPFPISKTPIIEIKQEQEDPGYLTMSTVAPPAMIREIVPLPVPSPAIVPPPQLTLLPIKQEKPDDSVTSRADSTTSPVKKIPLIPSKFIAPIPRKETPVSTSSNLSVGLDISNKSESTPVHVVKTSPGVTVPSPQSVSFSMSFKSVVATEGVNDSDSQDFTDKYVKKAEQIQQRGVEEVKADDQKKLQLSVDSVLKEIVEENIDETPMINTVEVNVENTEHVSPSSSLSEQKRVGVKPYSPGRKGSPNNREKPPSPRRRKFSSSPRDRKRTSLSDISKRSPLRSVSPKYRLPSPRRDSLTRRRSRDRSPIHRKDVRYRDRSSSPRRRIPFDKYDRRRKSPSPKSRKNHPGHLARSRNSISPKRQRSISPKNKNRRSPSPRIRRSISPRIRRSMSPRGYRSPFRKHSPNRRSSPQSKDRRRSYSRSVSMERKKETIQQTLQRLAGVDDRYIQATNKSPINSPIEGFKRSVADSTISDDQLLQQNSIESTDSPAYRAPSARLVHSPSSPKRLPLDVRINQVLGLNKDAPKPVTTTYAQTTYTQSYTYDQYTEQYGQYAQYGQNILPKSNYVPPPPPPVPKPTSHVPSSKVVQIGNVLQVVPSEEIIPPPEIAKQAPLQQIVQVGNMLQIVPSPTSHVPKEIAPPPVSVPPNVVQTKAPLVILQPALTSQVLQPSLPPLPPENKTLATAAAEKISAEELMLQKIAERRAERAKRHEERERKRNEKEKRRKEKEKKKQLRLKMKTENMIKKALRIETEALAMGESIDDNEESVLDAVPTCWPATPTVSNQPLKTAGKGILITQGVSKINFDCNEQRKVKSVKFADGVAPGEGTSPSGGEELSSPPPPKEKQFKKMKKKRLHKKKKIKVKIIRKSSTESPDDEELDNLLPPSPPPGSPPPHVFPARIKAHTINNIHPTYATGVPLMSVGNYPPQYNRPNVPMSMPPPIHNIPHVSHHGPSGARIPPQVLPQHGPPMHGSLPHGVPSGLGHGMSPHSHGLLHHTSGPRL